MVKKKRLALKLLSVAIACLIGAAFFMQKSESISAFSESESSTLINQVNASVKTNQEDFYNEDVIYRLPETVTENQEISVIVTMNTDTVFDTYNDSNTKLTLSEYIDTKEGVASLRAVEHDRIGMISKLNDSGISYELGEIYDTILSGFEITVKAKDFEAVQDALGSDATLIVGDVYEEEAIEVVENDVNVYSTGIFDSSESDYQGNGVVIAVLDTGLDYTHTAFSVENFTTPDSNLAFTLGDGTSKDIATKVGSTVASGYTVGLTGEDVYVSKKVPYAYDYADKDADVLPINSEHGTHVAGIIAGRDDVITGVAPNAQLAIMKVFSDTQDGAKTSWILAALEDCVILGVDVINMSLGSACGFSREVDNESINKIYDSIKEAGISLIVAASNSYNSTFGSEKNGNLGLTSNPDSGTVGSPATYDAALAVASISGEKTPYMLLGDDVIYFNEATDKSAKSKNFVDEILSANETAKTFEYVLIGGYGSAVDYIGMDISGKIALVKRGTTTFEDKIKAATDAGAAGIIIYNNVSGTISMSIGSATAPACSISQDDGELLVSAAEKNGGIGKITVSRDQLAGPFMSDFSSWGPTSDLKIKPEITAHGGNILSAVPGQSYDKLSGTSMAAPNQSGVTALIRQYVKEHIVDDNGNTTQVTALVNQIMMSTTDIAYNKNGLPYAVRKQGSGLANLTKATTTPAYLTTFEDGKVMDKTKLELGDDKKKTGVYEMTFAVNNISSKALTYNVDAIVMTEGVSNTYTDHGETTVTEEGYLLSGAKKEVTKVSSSGSAVGNLVTVDAGATVTVTLTVTLSDEDKQYLNGSFENGMYVEGFVTLTAQGNNNINLNVPFLAFYGDWTQAPIFDEEYFDTNTDELDAGIDASDKIMADAISTRVIGGLYSDYIAYLGSYYFVQDPSSTQIAASKEHIAISNQNNGADGNTTINSLNSVWAGLLRNVKRAYITIVEDSTGNVVYSKTVNNQRKSYNYGSAIYYSTIDIDFSAIENNLKNNTKYTVTIDAYIDYGEDDEQNNLRNRFEFPLYIDIEAPVVTDVTYRTVYDKINKTTKLYADLSIYDNHYAMGVQVGQAVASTEPNYNFALKSFGKYITPVYSSYNSTSLVTVELTEYINDIKNSIGSSFNADGSHQIVSNNSFIAMVYDYALNVAQYEIRLPDSIVSMFFDVTADAKKDVLNQYQINAGNIGADEQVLVLSPNETFDLTTILQVYPSTSWVTTLDYIVSDENVIGVVNGRVVARSSGNATITVLGKNASGESITAQLDVVVLTSDDKDLGYIKYDPVAANKFEVTGYTTDYAFYVITSADRDIGLTGGSYLFGSSLSLSMYPAEQVTLKYVLDSYFPDRTEVTFSSTRSEIASVDENGTITAYYSGNKDANAYITVTLLLDGVKSTSIRVSVTVKTPFITNSIYLMNYRGGGDINGVVEIPDDLGITTIYQYAFSGYEYVEKDTSAGDVIDDEDPYNLKLSYLGNDKIKKIIIPEGVTEIMSYAFANLTALEEVVLPSTLTKIGVGAFAGCTSLKTVNFDNVKFINKRAFYNTAIQSANFASAVSFGEYAFENSKLISLNLPESCQSIGLGAFYNCTGLASVVFNASKVKIGSYAFAGCKMLTAIDINAAVISSYAFYKCVSLKTVTLGQDVSVIGEFAFADTEVSRFNIDAQNKTLTTKNGNNAIVYKGEQLLLVAPAYSATIVETDATSIATGAFSANKYIKRVTANNVVSVGDYAFAECNSLNTVVMNSVIEVGAFAFSETSITAIPNNTGLTAIGDYAFYSTGIVTLKIADGALVGNYAFSRCAALRQLTIGDNVTLGEGAFYATALTTVTAGGNLIIGEYAFANVTTLSSVTLGSGAIIGAYAFYKVSGITEIDLSEALVIGDYAFANATALTTANLSSLKYLGEGAFKGATSLSGVSLGEGLKAIPDGAFYGCTSLTSVSLPDNITEIGAYAFAFGYLENINLNNITTIGEAAFVYAKLANIALNDNEDVKITIGGYAFYNVESLNSVSNLDNVAEIGEYAFVGTALTAADLSSAETIGDYAFANSALTSVNFGVKLNADGTVSEYGKLKSLGENPFYRCEIETYNLEVVVSFNGQQVETLTVDTYAISDTVQIISGAIYQSVPNGLELVSYPIANGLTSYTVEEGTVRISAKAFAGSSLVNVTIASTVAAIGDKAFYGCENLKVVVFKSYNAPILEEEYDESYLNTLPIPFEGYYVISYTNGTQTVVEGLGITKYYIWNIMLYYNDFYYGANFVNYVGRVTDKLTVIRPVNGKNYDTFIMGQYFGTVIEGATAADSITIAAIAAIAAIPATVELTPECEELVNAARAAYDLISGYDQRALVTNVSTLTSAERTLEYLKSKNENPDIIDVKPQSNNNSALIIGLSVGGAAIIVAAAAVTTVLLIKKRKKGGNQSD